MKSDVDEAYVVTMGALSDLEMGAMELGAQLRLANHGPRFSAVLGPLLAAIEAERHRRSGALEGFRGFIVPQLVGEDLADALMVAMGYAAGAAESGHLTAAEFYKAVGECLVAGSAEPPKTLH